MLVYFFMWIKLYQSDSMRGQRNIWVLAVSYICLFVKLIDVFSLLFLNFILTFTQYDKQYISKPNKLSDKNKDRRFTELPRPIWKCQSTTIIAWWETAPCTTRVNGQKEREKKNIQPIYIISVSIYISLWMSMTKTKGARSWMLYDRTWDIECQSQKTPHSFCFTVGLQASKAD